MYNRQKGEGQGKYLFCVFVVCKIYHSFLVDICVIFEYFTTQSQRPEACFYHHSPCYPGLNSKFPLPYQESSWLSFPQSDLLINKGTDSCIVGSHNEITNKGPSINFVRT